MEMIDLFLLCASFSLIGRQLFIFADDAMPGKRYFILTLIQIAGLLLIRPTANWLILLIVVILQNALFYWLEQKAKNLDILRLLSLAVLLITYVVFFTSRSGFVLHNWLIRLVGGLSSSTILTDTLSGVNLHNFLLLLFGLLLASNEVSLLVRLIIQRYTPVSALTEKGLIAPKGQDAGRVIGILERILIVIFIAAGQWAAIGFILVAKSFARYQQLNDKDFAEYVLIGTLLSALFSILIGMGVRGLMG